MPIACRAGTALISGSLAKTAVTRWSRAGAMISYFLAAPMPIACRAGMALIRTSKAKLGMTRWSRAGATVRTYLAATMPIACRAGTAMINSSTAKLGMIRLSAAPTMTGWMGAAKMMRSTAVLAMIPCWAGRAMT